MLGGSRDVRRGVQKSAWIVGHSMIFTFGAVRERSGDLLVSGEVLWGAFWCPGWHSGKLFGDYGKLFSPPGDFLEWILTFCGAFGANVR